MNGNEPFLLRSLRRVSNKLLVATNYSLVRRRPNRALSRSDRAVATIVAFWVGRAPPVVNWLSTGIVFSKDRPLQLDALLRSYYAHCGGVDAPPLDILFTHSNQRFSRAYKELQRSWAPPLVTWHEERNFRDDLLKLLSARQQEAIFFLVDDIIFIRNTDFSLLGRVPLGPNIPSLRLGPGITYSYFSDISLEPPKFVPTLEEPSLLSWEYRDAMLEWGFVPSTDGHIFLRDELIVMAESVNFKSPNSLEEAFFIFKPSLAGRKGVCFQAPRLVSVPLNVVQGEVPNRSGEISAEQLLEYWEKGLTIDVDALRGLETNSVHCEVALTYVPRYKA